MAKRLKIEIANKCKEKVILRKKLSSAVNSGLEQSSPNFKSVT